MVSRLVEVMVAVAILEDEDVDLLKLDMVLIEADRVSLIKAPGNVSIVDRVITSPKSAERNLIDLSGHNYLTLILLPRVILLMLLHLLMSVLPLLYYRRRSMIDYAS